MASPDECSNIIVENADLKNPRKRTSVPDSGYTCNNCGESGHWIQQCPTGKRKKKKKKSQHVPIEGVDPSEADKEKARAMQKLVPPNCYCGVKGRVKKVKQSRFNPNSRAIGVYFFFCAKKEGGCRFAKPIEEVVSNEGTTLTTDAEPKKQCMFFARGVCKKGDACLFSHA